MRRATSRVYKVEATDGSIGKVDEATYDTGSSYIVVDTGPWIFGKKVLLPAGVVSRVDRDDEKVYVKRTKDQVVVLGSRTRSVSASSATTSSASRISGVSAPAATAARARPAARRRVVVPLGP